MFNYFGSKQRLASTYQAPKHDIIIEPFAGAAAYSVFWLKRYSDTKAVIFDIDPLVIHTWQRILSLTPDEMWSYPNPEVGEMSDDLLWGSAASAISPWISVASGGQFQVTEWMARDFPSKKCRMAEALAAIGGRIIVEQAPYTEAPDIDATWFIDPPYQHQGHRYNMGSDAIDYCYLGVWSRARHGQVIVTEAEPADWLPFTPHRSHRTQANDQTIELVWYSDPEPTLFDHV